MRSYRKYVNLCVFLLILATAFQVDYNPFTINLAAMGSQVINQKDALYQKIQEKKELYSVKPQDAYIDRVWKKTAGRNGLEVNIEKSYEKMKETGIFDESKLVFDQISPEVSLMDLDGSPIYRGHPEKDMVAFFINVSWGEEHIPEMLRILKENQVKATFFIEGKWAQQNSEIVKMIDEQGHVIGNHAYNHPDMARLSNQAMIDQISQTNQILTAITGKKAKWFAPPSGSYNDQVVYSAEDLNMETILWTVDTIDWKNPSVSVMINRVKDKIHPGATILMHPTPATANGLEQLIQLVRESGYRLGTIDMLLSEER
ncbi:polysaccharide deacetylase family protein [Oceanobacillus profundus]|uniref:polysaccharide deacetylase family protein n=1 Tax=Oceanobacillus TaxID=182709 RepID=UPI0026E30A5A|nr:polysaccharide deacetylase family protein [Oceanobacillus profundus]MDO6449592.1 polysaccharide deacetylase family protein [Oceanobacillus profundus]